MWQRFTESARKAVFYAQEEAQNMGDGYVTPDHLLLGAIREETFDAYATLAALGVNLNEVRREIQQRASVGETKPAQDMTLTPRAKRVIDLAYQEAQVVQQVGYIGSAHLLLGILDEGGSVAAQVLAEMGVDLEAARREARRLEGRGGGSRESFLPVYDAEMESLFKAARAKAAVLRLAYVTPEIFLLTLSESPGNRLYSVLESSGTDMERLREAVTPRGA